MRNIPTIVRHLRKLCLLVTLSALPFAAWTSLQGPVSAQIQLPNPPPLLVYTNPQSVLVGNTLIVKPKFGLSDSGGMETAEVHQITPAGFTGLVTVDSSGMVTITNAGPVGAYTIVIRATDTSNQNTFARFKLRVSSQPCPSFEEATFSPFFVQGGGGIQDIVAGDFNGDGKVDLAVSKAYWDQLTILLGNGNGQFALAPGSPINDPESGSLEVADINRDGKLDLVTLEANGLRVLTGDGSGGFSKGPTIATPGQGSSFFSFHVDDFNADGRIDIAIAQNGNNITSIRILLNLPLLGWSEAPAVPFQHQLSELKSADFNNDGNRDLVVETLHLNPTFSEVRVFYGNGNGGFTPNLSAPMITGELFGVGDFNNDFKEDFVVILGSLAQSYLGNGMGQFSPAPASNVISDEAEPFYPAVMDFNLDGSKDLMHGHVYATSLTKLQNTGLGVFNPWFGAPVINRSRVIAVDEDFDNDGKVDVVGANQDGHISVYLHGNCGPSITPVPPLERSTCSPGFPSTIATVSDDDYAAGQLTVSVVSASAGVSVTGITNLNGLITAHVTAQNATPGSKTVNLRVTNPALQMDVGALTVNVVTTSQPLTLNQVSDLTVGATPDQCSSVVNYALPEASGGDCGGTVTTVCAPGPGFAFPLGTTTVNCTATDGLGGQAMTSFEVSVVDYQAPTFTNLNNLVINAAPGECTATVNYNIQAVDGCSNVVVVTDPPSGSVLPAGVTTVTAMATDAAGNTATGSFTVTVNGNCCGAPAITAASATPSTLWPPDHKMRDVTVNYSVTPGCGGAVTCTLSVTSNEPVNGLGDGDTAPDWQIIDAHHVKLRAERSGAGSGRVYTITITCTNSAGQNTSQSVTVTVPLNQ